MPGSPPTGRPSSPSTPTSSLRLRSVRGQLTALVVLSGLVVVAALTVLAVTVAQSNSAGRVARTVNQARAGAAQLSAVLADQQSQVRGYLLAHDADLRDQAAGDRAAVLDGVDGIRDLLAEVDVAAPELPVIVTAYDAWWQGSVVPELQTASTGGATGVAAAAARETGSGQAAFEAVRAPAAALSARLGADYRQALTRSTDLRSRVVWLVVAVLVLFVASLVTAAAIGRYAVIRPLRALQRATRRVAGGAWDRKVTVVGPDEFRELAADVERMRAGLWDGLEIERRAAEALRQQGPAVVALRHALGQDGPAAWRSSGFEFSARLDPVEGVLAGDWYDVLPLDPARTAVVVGDVAGHGPASGVYALRLKGLLRAALLDGASPRRAIAALARHVSRFPDDERVASGELFATVFVAVVDREAGTVTYCSAGHHDAVVLRISSAGGSRRPALRLHDTVSLPPTGPLVSALIVDGTWDEVSLRCAAGDVLVAATDGVIDARDRPADEEFGMPRVVEALLPGAGPGGDLVAAVATVFGDVALFEPRARDDRTLVAVRHSGTTRRFEPFPMPRLGPLRPGS